MLYLFEFLFKVFYFFWELTFMQLHNQIILSIASNIKIAFEQIGNASTLENIYKSIVEPPNFEMGHFAYPCFNLSKEMRKAPNQIATQLAELINQKLDSESFEKVEANGPYINFTIHNNLYSKIVTEILSKQFFQKDLLDKKETIIFEYSQPNTHKEIHVGHMRNLCLGNALVRTGKYLGNNIISATYPGDFGTHVAKCLWFLNKYEKGNLPKENKGAWIGQLYSKASILLDDIEKNNPEEAKKNNEELGVILKELNSGKGKLFDLWRETREWSIELMKKTYDWADIQFDKWYFESEVDEESLNIAKENYKKGLFVESEGAVGMDLKEEKLGFCIMIKSDGNGTYATKDIALAYQKMNDYSFDRSYYLVDERQSFHFKQIFKTLEKMNFKNVSQCAHLSYNFVELPDGAMSSRKGNIIPITDLINQMEATIKERYLNKFINEWSVEEINQKAKIIANGAIKYGMLKMDSTRKIVFDMNEWLKLEGETGPYLQYVYARINSLINRLSEITEVTIDKSTNSNFFEKMVLLEEKKLLQKLSLFNTVVCQSFEQMKPSILTSYLYDLGRLFNAFYAECPIIREKDDQLKIARILTIKATGITMKEGLSLLGIDSPDRM